MAITVPGVTKATVIAGLDAALAELNDENFAGVVLPTQELDARVLWGLIVQVQKAKDAVTEALV